MPRPEIALITAAKMPKADLDSGLLVEELARQQVRAQIMAWDSKTNWAEIPLVVLRTPWDYVPRFAEFLGWAGQVSVTTRILNPLPIVQWNSHKRYLLELAEKGVPVIPTRLISPDETAPTNLEGLFEAAELVIKPAVGVGARGTMRANKTDPRLAEHLQTLLQTHEALVQPFAPSVTKGEISLIYFEGQFSHALRKQPAPGDFRVHDHYGGSLHAHTPSKAELAVGEAALAVAPSLPTYARVDLVEFEGHPAIMELELIEPELFLRLSPEGTKRFAQILKAKLRA